MKSLVKSKRGFWGVLARKARSVIEDDDDVAQQYETPERRRQQMSNAETRIQYSSQHQVPESHQKPENPGLQKGLGVITSSLSYIGNALEEGRTIVENRTADIIQETRKLHIKKKSGLNDVPETHSTSSSVHINKQLQQMRTQTQPQTQTDIEIQLKASRDMEKSNLVIKELVKEKDEEKERLNGVIAGLLAEKEKDKVDKDVMLNRMSQIEAMLTTMVRI